MATTEQDQLGYSTDEQLRDRLVVLRAKYGPDNYPYDRLREFHLIEYEIQWRIRLDTKDYGRSESGPTDNHTALFEATDIETSLKGWQG